MKGHPIPEITGNQVYNWAVKLTGYLRAVEREIENPSPKTLQLEHAKSTAKATTDGLLMWDVITGSVIVSKNGAWHALDMTPLVLAGIRDKATR